MLLPGAEFLGAEHTPPARELADAGAICVLGTDLNPGTSPVASLPLIIGLAVRRYGLSVREALLAGTLNAAWVLRRSAASSARWRSASAPTCSSSTARWSASPTASGTTRWRSCSSAGDLAYVRPDCAWRVTWRGQ